MIDFTPHLKKIEEKLRAYKENNLKMFSTSSFQPQSVALLHILSKIDNSIPIYFLNTGYHFAETLEFRDQLAREFGLHVINVSSAVPKIHQRDNKGNLLYASDPDYCCNLNKVQPLEPVLIEKDVWINGIRKGQNANRSAMQEEEKSRHGVLRYHPILEWSASMVFQYINRHKLPRHPLEGQGFLSIGCQPCTRKVSSATGYDDRSGRWSGSSKTECGLHTDLVVKK